MYITSSRHLQKLYAQHGYAHDASVDGKTGISGPVFGCGHDQEVKDYYKELYGVDLSGEQVQRMYHPGREAAAGYKK